MGGAGDGWLVFGGATTFVNAAMASTNEGVHIISSQGRVVSFPTWLLDWGM